MTDFQSLLKKKTLIVIAGPTASGKTSAAVELAKLLLCEVISADSRQVFKYMDIGTAKPTIEEQKAVKHHFIDIVNPDEYYSAGVFGDKAAAKAEEIFASGKLPLVVGGSGLYIKALCEGFFEDEDNNENRHKIRRDLEKSFETDGIVKLYDELKLVDSISAEKYTDKNPRRILRALEYYKLKGKAFSAAHQENKSERDFNVIYFGIESNRSELYHKINIRAEQMWHSGLIEETKKLLEMGYSPELNSLNTVGYKECLSFLDGKMTEAESLDKMKQSTRNYAKRQMTWFRRIENITWLSGDSKEIAGRIYKKIKFY